MPVYPAAKALCNSILRRKFMSTKKPKVGSRNTYLVSLAGKMFNRGVRDTELCKELCKENDTFKEPLPIAEIEAMVRSSKSWT